MGGIYLLVLVVMGAVWWLGGPGPYGLAIGSAVCVVVAMTEIGRLVTEKTFGGLRGGG